MKPTTSISLFILVFAAFGCHLSSNKIFKLNEKAVNIKPEEEKPLKERFKEIETAYQFNDSTGWECANFNFKENHVSVCAYNDRGSDSSITHFAYVTADVNGTPIADTIDQKQPVYISTLNISFDIYKDYFFVAWVAENQENNIPSSIIIECFDLKTKKKLFQKKVFEQRWGIIRLAISFNPFTHSVLFAYNDLSAADSKYLFLGSLSLTELEGFSPVLKPISVLNQDPSEKRFPKFLRTDTTLYLYHTSGDTWGVEAHTGQQGLGISRIDKNNLPADYKTLADKNTINEEILLDKDILYYQLVTGTNYGSYDIKKIALKDLEHVE